MGINLSRLTLLLVDDNDHIRRLLRLLLKSLNLDNVREAKNGAEALTIMENWIPDILLTDWVMEPVDGLELTKLVRNSENSPNRFMPIIMVSGHSERGRVLAARDAGVTEFLVKPVSAKGLYSRIANVIEHPRQFVRTKLYFGPDRRRRKDKYGGDERRGTAPPADVEMSQAEINNLFNPDSAGGKR